MTLNLQLWCFHFLLSVLIAGVHHHAHLCVLNPVYGRVGKHSTLIHWTTSQSLGSCLILSIPLFQWTLVKKKTFGDRWKWLVLSWLLPAGSFLEALCKQCIVWVNVHASCPIGTPSSFSSVWWWLNSRRQWKVFRLAQQQIHSRCFRHCSQKEMTFGYMGIVNSFISWV